MTKQCLYFGILNALLATSAFAQPGGFGGAPGGPGGDFGPGRGLPPNPLVEAIDADSDGAITLEELTNAKKILAKLDENKDGKITEDEMRPNFGRFGRGPGGEGRGGRSARGGAAGGGEGPLEIWMSLDKNEDGKLEKSEVGARMQGLITRADTDNDGVATKAELAKLASREGGGEGVGIRGVQRRGGDAEGRGGRQGRGGDAEGRGGRRGGEAGRGGPQGAEGFVARAMNFDANGDDQLSKGELEKMAGEMMQRMGGRGGRGGFGGGERGGRGGRGGEGGRRPARPE